MSASPTARRSFDKSTLSSRHVNRSLCSHSRRFRPRASQTDSNGSDIGMEDLPSARPSCAGSDVTITSGSSPMVDFTSSFTIIEETTPPKDDVQHDRQLLQHKQNSPLHHPHNAKHLLVLLQKGYDPNQKDFTHDQSAPIHSIVRSQLKDRPKCLQTLLVHGEVDVDLCDAHGMTALHFASMLGDLRCIKLLLAFGANINAISSFDQTPMNLAIAHYQENVIKLFSVLGGISAAFVMLPDYIPLPKVSRFRNLGLPFSPDSSDNEFERGIHVSYNVQLDSIRPYDLQFLVEERMQLSFSVNEEEAVSMIINQNEPVIHRDIPEIMHCLTHTMHNGSRILCLDGMGSRGLIEIEILEHLVEITGQEVTEMFDIICGSSIGGLLALGLVYGKKSLNRLRQILYKFKDDVFNTNCSEVYREEQMDLLLREAVGTSLSMCDIKEPKVMVFAVNRELSDLKLQVFSNFLNDDLSHEQVLQVAKCSISNPILSSQCGDYIDASVLANNPCDYMLTRLQHYYYQRKEQCPVAMVVSVGTGVYSHDRELPTLPSHKFKSKETLRRIQNLLVLMKSSIVQSEDVAKNCQLRCQQLNIPFYRFSPKLREKVFVYETETRKLLNSVLRTRLELQNSFSGLGHLKECIHQLAKSYTASGGGLCINVPSDIASPSELLPHPVSSDTTSSGEELQKIRHCLQSSQTPYTN